MNPFSNWLRAGLLALALVGGAQAATVTVDFSVSGVAGSGSGFFRFDDTSGSPNAFGETEYSLSSFSFSFGGSTYDLSDLGSAWVVFDGSTLLGLDASADMFSFVPGVGGQDPFLVTARATATVAYDVRNPQPVPEPGSAALVLLAAGALWAGRRRVTARR